MSDMLRIHYFASLREALGTGQQELPLPEGVATVGELADHLAEQGGSGWEVLKEDGRVLAAVNQTMVERSHALKGDEEVAFFPPVTGG